MNTSNGPVRPTPRHLNPPDNICLQLNVPNDPEWIAAFYDALYQLTLWMAWQRDDAHTGKDIAARWWETLNSVQLCQEEQAPSGCPSSGDDYLLRQNPTNPCLLETSADGTHWCTLIDLTLCTPSTGQPGSGARQPLAGGGSACYEGAMHAGEVWLLPTVVNAGDVLTFSNIKGAGSDGTLQWFCPTGSVFFAGACVGSFSFSGTDPAPAIYHAALVAKIGAAYYDITAGPITVPGGITNAPVYVQMNDATLAGNSGDYTFGVCVVNNAATTFTHVFDFKLGLHGWITGGAGGGVWSAGVGIVSTPDSGNKRLTALSPTVAAFGLTSFETIGSFQDNGNGGTRQADYSDGTFHTQIALPNTAGAFDTLSTTPHTGVIQIGANLDTFASTTGQNVLSKIIVTGNGADPF